MSALTGSLLLVIFTLLATCLVLWQRGNVHKVKRFANADAANRMRRRSRSLAGQIALLRNQLAVAEEVNSLPCQCGCDSPIYDRVVVQQEDVERQVRELLAELDAGEVG